MLKKIQMILKHKTIKKKIVRLFVPAYLQNGWTDFNDISFVGFVSAKFKIN